MSSDVAVATWNLRPTKQKAAESFLDTSPTLPHSGGETSLNGDTRKIVPQAYRQPKGRYYSIVKLQMKYEGQAEDDPSYAMGTGWLIKDDLLVTAGHCAFDHQYGYGRAVEVKAYVGYYGRESVENDKANVQFRHGVTIATTKGWINSDANRANDVSFIRLDRAFRNVVPFKWEATPVTAYSVDLGVVGYPADQKKGDEHGAEMYEMFLESSFDLRSTPSNMLEYQISTYAGQSGSPVFKRDGAKLTPIGAHVYGLGNRNSASVIRGQYGNDFGAHIDALDPKKQFETITTTSSNITYLRVPSRTPEGSFDFQTESFADVLKKVLDVGAKVAPVMLQAGSPFLGLQGNKIASAVSTAIIAANEITKSRTESALKSDLQTIPYKSYAARAVLAEATLQHVLYGPGDDSNMKIYESMKKSMQRDFAKNNVQVKFFANKFGLSLLEPALRIAVVDAASKTGAEAALIDSYPRIGSRTTVDQLEDPNKKAFVEKLSSQPNAQTAPEGFLDFLCPLASLAVKSIGAVINVINSESASDAPPTPPDSMQAHIEVLCHRALIAEAALQAALEIPVEDHPEGFWSSLVSTVKDISGTVMKVAPSVIKVVTPIVKSLTESSITKPGNTKPKTGGRSLKPRPSIADMLRGGVATNDVATDGVDTNDYAADGVDMNDPTTDGPTESPVSYRIQNVSDEMTSMVSAPERQHDGLYFEDIAPPAN